MSHAHATIELSSCIFSSLHEWVIDGLIISQCEIYLIRDRLATYLHIIAYPRYINIIAILFTEMNCESFFLVRSNYLFSVIWLIKRKYKTLYFAIKTMRSKRWTRYILLTKVLILYNLKLGLWNITFMLLK